MRERPAVYLIVHRDTQRVYVGSTANLSNRQWTAEQRARISEANKRSKPLHQPGDQCIRGHIKDGTYVKIKPNGSVKIRCQECERIGARERARRLAQRKKGVMPNES
jgi:hypothetical protein